MLMQNFGVTNKEHYGMLWYSQFIEFILVRGKLLSISRVRYNHSENDGQEKKSGIEWQELKNRFPSYLVKGSKFLRFVM